MARISKESNSKGKPNRSFIDHEPITNSIGQIEHQTVYTQNGEVVDHDDFIPDIVESNGLAVIPEQEEKLKKYIKEAVSVQNLIETFNVNAHETLLKLLAIQDNIHPLKKGGIGVAYRTDALIMHCKMEFTSQENIVFDAILGTMSSYPENISYKIEPASFLQFSKYANEKYIYTIFSKGAEKLKNRHLEFENLGADGEDDLSIPWFNILKYHKGKKGTGAYIEFVPSDFFKVLALSSQLVHGAYGALEVTMQLTGKYTIALYWYLENKKNYREYRGAASGVFYITMEEFRHQFSIPDSYTVTDLERKVLGPAKSSINSVAECDFTFTYEPQKQNGVFAGYKFVVKSKKNIANTGKTQGIEKKELLSIAQVKMFLSASNLMFDDSEIERIHQQALKYNRTPMFMMQAIISFRQRIDNEALEPIEDYVGYLCKMIELGIGNSSERNNNKFNNFQQNDYDFEEFERQIIDN